LQLAEAVRTILERTRGQVIVVADHSKLGVVANFMIAPVEKVDVLVVDSDFDESYREEVDELGIEIIVASM
jgi:DeoR family fructose operon transcriptional repressor